MERPSGTRPPPSSAAGAPVATGQATGNGSNQPTGAAPPEPTSAAPVAPVVATTTATARQRWRLVLARDATAPELGSRELADAWEAAFESTGLPAYRTPGRTRARVAFGAPVPARMALERELADILLTDMLPAWTVREALTARLPVGWRLLDMFDVWLGAPALAAQVAAADYRIALDGLDDRRVRSAIDSILAARSLPRERPKGATTVAYDLRPLLIDVAVVDAGPPLVVRTRTRFDPALGTGRPEEVVAALGDAAGDNVGDAGLAVRSIVRERLIVEGDPS